MKVRVRFFAGLREATGIAELSLEVPEKATAEDAWTTLASKHRALEPYRKSLGLAVNRAYAPFSRILCPGDEIVFIPPISGG